MQMFFSNIFFVRSLCEISKQINKIHDISGHAISGNSLAVKL